MDARGSSTEPPKGPQPRHRSAGWQAPDPPRSFAFTGRSARLLRSDVGAPCRRRSNLDLGYHVFLAVSVQCDPLLKRLAIFGLPVVKPARRQMPDLSLRRKLRFDSPVVAPSPFSRSPALGYEVVVNCWGMDASPPCKCTPPDATRHGDRPLPAFCRVHLSFRALT